MKMIAIIDRMTNNMIRATNDEIHCHNGDYNNYDKQTITNSDNLLSASISLSDSCTYVTDNDDLLIKYISIHNKLTINIIC